MEQAEMARRIKCVKVKDGRVWGAVLKYQLKYQLNIFNNNFSKKIIFYYYFLEQIKK